MADPAGPDQSKPEPTSTPEAQPARMLRLGTGGWVILLAMLLCGVVVTWRLGALIQAGGSHAVGDGKHLESYGYDLSTCLVSKTLLVPGGMPKDRLRALVDPAVLTPAEADVLTEELRGKYLVSHDRVLGVVIGEEARAYPIRVMRWHEIANDQLGGRAIAVTYNPLCDSALVFDREVGSETLEFGVSGLVFNSNLVMYDRRPEAQGESLWSQLQARAIAGPAAARGESLARLPGEVTTWQDWRTRHPETTVLDPDPEMYRLYRGDPYANYRGSTALKFPVDPLPPAHGMDFKTRVLAVRVGDLTMVYPLVDLIARADQAGLCHTQFNGATLRFITQSEPDTARIEMLAGSSELQATPCYWFAWYACHPDDSIIAELP
jgi:hypothetical protein